MIIGPGRRVIHSPNIGITIHTPCLSADTDWWLAGGINPANVVAAYRAKGAASYAASKINLANPGTYDCVDGVAYPSWAAATGWTFVTASSQYLNTGILLPSSGSVFVQIANASAVVAHVVAGCSGTTGVFDIWPGNGAVVIYRYGTNYTTPSARMINGNLGIAGTQPYKNGVADGATLTNGFVASATYPLHIGRWNRPGDKNYFTGDVTKMAVYSTTLSAAQSLALATAMAA